MITKKTQEAAPVAFEVTYQNGVHELQWANDAGERDDYEDTDERYGEPREILTLVAASPPAAPVAPSKLVAPDKSVANGTEGQPAMWISMDAAALLRMNIGSGKHALASVDVTCSFQPNDLHNTPIYLSAATDTSRVSYELLQNDEWCAEADAFSDALHYAIQYSHDGPVELYKVTREKVNLAEVARDFNSVEGVVAAQNSPPANYPVRADFEKAYAFSCDMSRIVED